MLNFYTAKQGEKLEERVSAVEQGGGGSGIETLEIDCTGLVTEGKDYFDPSDSGQASTMLDLADAEKAFKSGTIIVLKNLKMGVGSSVPEEQQFTQTIYIYAKSTEDLSQQYGEGAKVVNYSAVVTTIPGRMLAGAVCILKGYIAIMPEEFEDAGMFVVCGASA